MLISTKGRYALRVMIDLAEHQGEGFIPLKIIARRQEISEKYLENIIKLLVRAKQYTVGAILRLTEDSLAPVSCMEADAAVCPRAAKCRTLPIWQGLAQVINDYLDHITLADLMQQDRSGNDYVI